MRPISRSKARRSTCTGQSIPPGKPLIFCLPPNATQPLPNASFVRCSAILPIPIPRVINVDKNAAYPPAIKALKQEGVLPRRVRLRQCKFLNNIVEQSHRNVKKRTWLAKSYKRFHTAWRTLEGIETMEMIRKGRVRWVAKKDVVAEVKFIAKLFPIAA